MRELMNIVGNRYGEILVLREVERRRHKNSVYRMVECQCDCGKIFITRMTALTSGHAKSCGHHSKDNFGKQAKRQLIDLTGQHIGHLTIKENLGVINRHTVYVCVCDCGAEFKKQHSEIINGRKKGSYLGCHECSVKYRVEISKAINKIKLKGENNGMYGRRGALAPQYDHNKTEEERILGRKTDGYKQFIANALNHFKYTCDICGSVGEKLNIHHLNNYKDYPKQRTDINNVVCLCEKHHKLFHKLYKNRNNTREQYYEFKRQYRANQINCEQVI